jgi:tetratricopeptide (TPR) repeat protein
MAQLAQQKEDDYRNVCAKMIERFGESDDLGTLEWVTWTCVLYPAALEDLNRLLPIAEKVLASDPDGHRLLTNLGGVLYRAGRYDEAIEKLTKVSAAWDQSGGDTTATSPAYTWFFLAMAHHRAGHTEEAKTWFDRAAAWVEEVTNKKDPESGEPTYVSWNRRLTFELLHREAEKLIQGRPQ